MIYRNWKNPLKKGLLIFVAIVTSLSETYAADSGKILINEFMAINNTNLADTDGEYSDWIELYNPGTSDVNLNGWYITDNPDNLPKWQFPDVTISAGGYFVIFASEKNYSAATELHTNFKLSGSGEYLALIEPDGITFSSSFSPGYPYQQKDVSYGLYNGVYTYMDTPTPNAANTAGSSVFAPQFDVERGFFESSFNITLSSVDSNYDIYYTTDGTIPSASTGTKYSSPFAITTTTVLSAICVDKTTSDMSVVVTNTYLFIDDILNQPSNPSGYPSEWGPFIYAPGNAPADYEMDPEVCTTANKDKLINALKSIPTVSIVTNSGYLFSHDPDATLGGIYIYTGDTGFDIKNSLGSDWERPVSIEYFNDSTSLSFQINCGLRLHGGNSRKPDNSPKHSFRASFRSDYGPTKLNFNLFNEKSATNEFNSLVFRAGYNYSWVKNDPLKQTVGADYMKDPFAKNTMLDMDRVAAHNKFVHLYLNGIYWGIYNISEKITNDFLESYLGGNEDDYEIVSDDGIFAGSGVDWSKVLSANNTGYSSNANYFEIQGENEDGTINSTYKNLVDVRNLIDYMITNFYMANTDWDHNNWYAGRNSVTNKYGFRFFAWDAETSMYDLNANIINENNENCPSEIYHKMKSNDEFKLYFADRIQKHFFNGGDLTPESASARYMKMANTINMAIMGESARWGDYRRDVSGGDKYDLYTREDYWLENVNYMQDTYFPNRTDIVLQQFKNAGLFPDLEAPIFSHYGGDITESVNVSISSSEGTIYYTTDDNDPREIGGAVAVGSASAYSSPLTITQDTIIKARVKSGNDWSPIVKVKFDYKGTATYITDNTLTSSGVVSSTAYPNPFSVSTNITYNLPADGVVNVSIVSIDGRIIAELYNGIASEGNNVISWTPNNQKGGIYFYVIHFNNETYTGKLIYKK